MHRLLTGMFTSSLPIMAKRRERGSVVTRGNAWLVRVSAGTDPVTGKRLWLSGTCDSPQEAGELRKKLLGQVNGRKASRTRASLSALLHEWLPGTELRRTPATTTPGSSTGSSGGARWPATEQDHSAADRTLLQRAAPVPSPLRWT
jgi:hypothetical protein